MTVLAGGATDRRAGRDGEAGAGASKGGRCPQAARISTARPACRSSRRRRASAMQPMMGVFNNLVVLRPARARRTACESIVPDLATELVVERGRHRADLPAAPGRQMARRQAVHRRGRQMHLGPADRARRARSCASIRANPGTATSTEVTTNGDYEVTFHLKRPQPALLDAAGLRLVAGLSLPRVAARDAQPSDRHRPVQIRRVQAERVRSR